MSSRFIQWRAVSERASIERIIFNQVPQFLDEDFKTVQANGNQVVGKVSINISPNCH